MGTKKMTDFSTEGDHDGFFTTSVVGSTIDAAGERVYYTRATTGAGAFFATAPTDNGVICVRNSAHASHPYTAGVLKVRIYYVFQ